MSSQSSEHSREYRAAITLAKRLCTYGQPQRALRVLDLAEWICPSADETRKVRISALAECGLWDDALDLLLEGSGEQDGALMARVFWALGEQELGDHYYMLPNRKPPPKRSAPGQ